MNYKFEVYYYLHYFHREVAFKVSSVSLLMQQFSNYCIKDESRCRWDADD